MLSTENKVVMNVPSAMTISPRLYLIQNSVPYEATGIAAKTTLIWAMVSSHGTDVTDTESAAGLTSGAS